MQVYERPLEDRHEVRAMTETCSNDRELHARSDISPEGRFNRACRSVGIRRTRGARRGHFHLRNTIED